MILHNKQKHPINGFKDCFTFMTMNNLPYPFNEDIAGDTDEDKERKKYDKGAFNARMKRINLEESFTLADKFPISVIEFAHILL